MRWFRYWTISTTESAHVTGVKTRSERMRLGCGLAVWLCAATASAHVVYGTKTLAGFVAEADLVVHARILASEYSVSIATDDGTTRRPGVEAEVLDVLKGNFASDTVRFVQHGHGVAAFEAGQEALLFLLRIERKRELGELARAGAVDWVSLQEHGDVYPLRPATRESLLTAVRNYVAAAERPESADEMMRLATLALLDSKDADLAASAVRELAVAEPGALVSSADLPALLGIVEDPATSMGVRCALLAELERRGLVAGTPHWVQLLATPEPTRDRITAIRAAGARSQPALRPPIAALLNDSNADVAAAAALALGQQGDEPALADALSHDVDKVRFAAIRSLGRIRTPTADRALNGAADTHPDSATRRRARSELEKRKRSE